MNSQKMDWVDHIRKRPGMYVGRLDDFGFVGLYRGCLSMFFHELTPERMYLTEVHKYHYKIQLDGA